MFQKLISVTYLFFIFFNCTAQLFTQTEWENPSVIDIGKEPPHAHFIPLGNKNETNDNSSLVKSLNGIWKFNYVDKPDDRPTNFFKNNFNDVSWKEIEITFLILTCCNAVFISFFASTHVAFCSDSTPK